jgi:hypothetical protein
LTIDKEQEELRNQMKEIEAEELRNQTKGRELKEIENKSKEIDKQEIRLQKKLHQFWCDVDNEIMKKIQFDEETCCNLPDKDTSPDVYLVDPVGLQKVKEKEPEKQNVSKSGGDSLLRSREEEMDSIMISCTVTIREKDTQNQNQESLNQLDYTATTSFQPSSNTVVVRPA